MAVLNSPSLWPSVTATTVLWAAAAGSAVFWGLRLSAPAEAALPPVAAAAPVPVDAGSVARFLGAPTAAFSRSTSQVDPATRFRLLGVVADEKGQGVALLAVDGKPARPYRAGASLGGGQMLLSVEGRSARIGAEGSDVAAIVLELPALKAAQNGLPREAPALSN